MSHPEIAKCMRPATANAQTASDVRQQQVHRQRITPMIEQLAQRGGRPCATCLLAIQAVEYSVEHYSCCAEGRDPWRQVTCKWRRTNCQAQMQMYTCRHAVLPDRGGICQYVLGTCCEPAGDLNGNMPSTYSASIVLSSSAFRWKLWCTFKVRCIVCGS